ncbi:MAG TPA: hypothetical protein PLN81_10615 [Bacillota bacterium]|nr:hypothetical protein [Bacillota bacterium]
MEQNLPERVTRLEQQADSMQEDIAEIKDELKRSATKDDVADLKTFFADRDRQFNDKLWRAFYGLLLLLGAMVVAFFGLKEIPKIFL